MTESWFLPSCVRIAGGGKLLRLWVELVRSLRLELMFGSLMSNPPQEDPVLKTRSSSKGEAMDVEASEERLVTLKLVTSANSDTPWSVFRIRVLEDHVEFKGSEGIWYQSNLKELLAKLYEIANSLKKDAK
jgi:hypothetical protein